MGTEFYAFEMLSGQRLIPLPVEKGSSWRIATNDDDSISCKIKATEPLVKKLGIWESTTLARNGLLAVVDDVPVAAGPIWKRSYKQGDTINLTAGGLFSYWNRRVLLPVAARGQALIDPAGDPVPAFDTNLSGLSYGTIVKRWIQLVRAWPGGAVPMMLPADELGTRVRNVAAIDLKFLRGLIDNIMGVENGPDIAFRPRWSDDGLGIYWEMQTGTNDKPRLGSEDASLIKWTVGAPNGGAFDLNVEEDATGMAEEVFAGGGRSGDRTLVAQARNTVLADAGFPLLQAVDTSHTTVVEQATMQGYANQGAKFGQFPSSFWDMSVRAKENGSPSLGDYWLGDMATITIDPAEPVLGRRYSYDVERRIAALSGAAGDDFYKLTFAEAFA